MHVLNKKNELEQNRQKSKYQFINIHVLETK